MARYFTMARPDGGSGGATIERAGDDDGIERERDRVERERFERARASVLAGVRAAGGPDWDDDETMKLYDVDRAAKMLADTAGIVDEATFWLCLFACLRCGDGAPAPRGWRGHRLAPAQRARLEEVARLGASDALLDALAADLARPARDADVSGALAAGRPLRAAEVANALAAAGLGTVVPWSGGAAVATGAGALRALVLIGDSDDPEHPHGIGMRVEDAAGAVLAIGAWSHGIERAGCADVVAWVAGVIRAWRVGVSGGIAALLRAADDDDGPPGDEAGGGGAGGMTDESMASGPARCDRVPAGALAGVVRC